jgi:hypothetical protein
MAGCQQGIGQYVSSIGAALQTGHDAIAHFFAV